MAGTLTMDHPYKLTMTALLDGEKATQGSPLYHRQELLKTADTFTIFFANIRRFEPEKRPCSYSFSYGLSLRELACKTRPSCWQQPEMNNTAFLQRGSATKGRIEPCIMRTKLYQNLLPGDLDQNPGILQDIIVDSVPWKSKCQDLMDRKTS